MAHRRSPWHADTEGASLLLKLTRQVSHWSSAREVIFLTVCNRFHTNQMSIRPCFSLPADTLVWLVLLDFRIHLCKHIRSQWAFELAGNCRKAKKAQPQRSSSRIAYLTSNECKYLHHGLLSSSLSDTISCSLFLLQKHCPSSCHYIVPYFFATEIWKALDTNFCCLKCYTCTVLVSRFKEST